MFRFDRKRAAGFAALSLATAAAAMAVGCEPRGTDLGAAYSPPVEVELPAEITFAYLKTNVLDPSCVSCHEDMATEQGLRTYYTAGNSAASALYLRVADSTMPPGAPLSDPLILAIKTYIDQAVPPSEPPAGN